ncbi:hypothetical protein JYU34_022856 [Plutella xylostella]|uniref:Peptidase aspartic putative domain-containing protein n=1 Tax=Plutella xylostella TaxID=51655 RepID=A0ABQ7PPD8_PLUXY|nr:hypothetical protein JYU34_022856 [Plutella xylostella]
MEQVEALFENQVQILEAIKNQLRNFKKDTMDRKSLDSCQRRLETLEKYWIEFQNNDQKLRQYEIGEHEYFAQDYLNNAEKMYNDVKEYIQSFIRANYTKPSSPLQKPKFQWPQVPVSTEMGAIPKTPSNQQSTSGNLEYLLRKQRSNFKAFAHTLSTINLDAISEKWEFDDILKNLQARWSTIDSLHWEIDSESLERNAEYEESFIKYEHRYQTIKKALNTKMWSVSHRDKSTPQMDIPFFSGDYRSWISFKDLFVEAIHNNRSLSDAQKMQFLKSKLRGEAEKLVQHLNISAANYDTCWEILTHRYHNIKLIFSNHASTLMNLSCVQQQSATQIKKIHDTTKESLYAINNLGIDTSTWDPLIVHIVSQKLDAETLQDYVESVSDPRAIPSLKEFLQFLENKFTSLESSRRKLETPKSSQQHEVPKNSKNNNFYKSFSSSKKPLNSNKNSNFENRTGCRLCNKKHLLIQCNQFLKLQSKEKLNVVQKFNYCVNCLYDHHGNACVSESRCRQCGGFHNTWLHEAFSRSEQNNRNQSSNVAMNNERDVVEVLLATALIKVQAANGSYQQMRALIDQGSQTSLITENAAQQLGINRQRCNGVIFGVGVKENACKGMINITCLSNHSDYQFTTDVFIMRSLINKLPNQSFPKPSWSFLENIQLSDPDFSISRPVDLLLGADVYSSIIMNGIIRENQSLPIAQQTRLGWILCGRVKSYHCNVVINNLDEIKRFWTTEDIGEEPSMSKEDYNCVQFYKETTTRREDGRYVVRLPLKSDANELLGDSRSKAVAQFRQLERKFHQQPELARDYQAFLKEYEELGHMHLVSAESSSMQSSRFFFPHHCVKRAESTTTSLRVVFNGSSRSSSGHSLNDVMYTGPNLQKDLFDLILKWRIHQFAFTADIEKMYRQILVHPDDQQYQMIIWRDSPNQPLQEYQLGTVTYGCCSSPFIAMMTLQHLANEESSNYSTML